MRSLYLVVGLTLVFYISANAQPIASSGGGTGLWSDPNSWSPATVPTAANSSSVVINSGHTITVSDTRSIDQLTVTGTLIINAAVVFTIADGTGTDLTVAGTGTLTNNGTFTLAFDPPPPPILNATAIINGTFNNAGTINNAAPSRLTFGAGSTYNHQQTAIAGVIPSSTWNATSTCQITGYTTNASAPTGLGQTFGHFTWDTPLLENYINLNGVLTQVTGNLTINNIPATYIALTESTNYNLNVGGNLTINNSYISTNGSATVSITVAGSTLFSNNNDLTMVYDGTTNLDCNGSLTFDGGVNNLTYDGPGSLLATVTGDFSLTNSPQIANAGSGTYRLTFDGAAATPQAYVAAQEFTGFSYVVQNGSQVNVGSGSAFMGPGAFTLQGGATLGVGSVNGLVTGTSQGAVRVSGTRTYTLGANIIYNGSVAQNLGSEWGSTGALSGVSVNLEIANTSGTGVSNNIIGGTSLVGRLRLTQGSLNIGNSNTLIISGDFEGFSSPTRIGTMSGDPSGTSDLQFTGSGTMLGTLNFTSGASTLKNFTIGRNTDIPLGTNLVIATAGTLSFTQSGNLLIDGLTLTINGNITQAGTGTISSSVNTTNLVIGGSGALATLPLSSGCQFNNVTLSRGSGTYTWNANATVAGILDLSSGALTHSSGLTMGTGSTFRRSAGTSYAGNVPNATTRFSVSYVGNLTTSNELSTTANNVLENLTTAGDATLDKNIIINGNVNINSGTLAAGAHDVTMLGATFAINGGTFTMNTSNLLTFSRVGSATSLSGTTIANAQFGNVAISTGAIMSAPNANIFISGSWDNQGTFTPNTGTVTFNGTSPQNIDAAGQAFFNFATAGSGTKTLTSTLDVNGALSIGPGTTLFADTFTMNVAGLWTNGGTFDAGTGTVVFDGTTQTINNAGQAFNNVTVATSSSTKTLAAALDVNGALVINSGVTLDVTASNFDMTVARNFTNNGTFNPRAATITFDGGSGQTISGTTNTVFNNITVNKGNNSTATFSSDQSLAGVLTLTDGVFSGNNHFIMLSTATRDARIAPLGVTASIAATNVIVQRYLPNTDASQSYRYLSSPVLNGTVAGWKDDFPITGTFTDPSTKPEWPAFPNLDVTFPTLYRYNEAMAGSPALNSRYESYPLNGTSSTAATLTNGRGYTAYIRQTGPITIEQVGTAASGPVPVTITNSGGPVPADDGWNLIGNPYPSPIHWNNVTRPTGVQSQIAFKDNTDNVGLGSGQYLYFTQGGAGIPGVFDGTIAAGQAFWVRNVNSGTSPVLTFQEDDKQPVNAPPFIREGIADMLRINVASTTKTDEILIGFNDNALDVADIDYDAYKLKNDFINFSSLSTDNNEMAINILGPLTCSKEIPLHLKTVTPGGHIFTFTQIETFSQNVEITLLDSFTGETVSVTEGTNTYSFQVTTDPTSFGTSRFKMFIGYPSVDAAVTVEASNVCVGGDANIKILVPQAGVAYYATLNGTTISDEIVATAGSDLSIPVLNAKLTSPENHVVLMARSAGCAAVPLSNSATISIESIPAISDVADDAHCGEGLVTLEATGAPTGGSYHWYLTEDATDAIVGESSSSFVTPLLSKTKTYFVSAVNSLGCEGGRMAVTATITYPEDAAITVDGSILTSSSDTGNQWYLNGAAIPGATGKTYEAEQSGVYKLIVTSGPCMTQVEREFAVTGDINGDGLKGYVLYPNPSPGMIYVEVATREPVRVSVKSQLGVEITAGELKQEGEMRKGQLDISGHANGIYLVTIKHNDKTVLRKIVKN